MKHIVTLKIVMTFVLSLCFVSFTSAQLSGTLHLDNQFEVYLSTDDSVQGTLLTTGNNWTTAYALSATLDPYRDYYLHIIGIDTGGVAGFLGDFTISGTEHVFTNGLSTLTSNASDWVVSTTGWSNYLPATGYGTNGVSPWGARPSVEASAEWIWSADSNNDNLVYFSTKISATSELPPIANYRFDEDQYNDVAGEVIDSIGGLNGQAKVAQPVAGKICNAVDLSATGINDYVLLDESILDGKTDFTVSLWVKTAQNTGEPTFMSGARTGNFNEFIFYFQTPTNFIPYLFGSATGNIPVSSIGTDIWHHWVWTREGTQNCLYRDKVLQGCTTSGSNSALSIERLILGQEQDSVGGGFVSDQTIDGLVDDLLVFDEAISISRIEAIYNNQNAGWNFDGSVPSCPVEAIAAPILDYRFDDCFYTGTSGDVADQSGRFNASTNGISDPSIDAVANTALNLSANNDLDWLSVPSNALNGLNDFTLSLWFKTNISKAQQYILHALGSDITDHELSVYLQNANQLVVSIAGSELTLNSSISFSDNAWHHLTLTRVGINICLFIDGVMQDCSNTANSSTLSVLTTNAVVIGQKQGQFGGSFTVSENFEGLLDEFKLFDSKLSGRQIAEIYQSESAGNNYDGAARNPVRCPRVCGVAGTLNGVGIIIGSGGSDTAVNTTTEALNIKDAWLAAGSPSTGLIDGGNYNVLASGQNSVDRIDFGGSNGSYSGTLPYPGLGSLNNTSLSHFVVYTEGTINLKAGDYTIFVQSDDGFSFVLETVSGDTVAFNKFGGRGASASNELRYEDPTGNSRTGGSFTLTQDSVFDASFIFFERTGGDFAEVSITNSITTSTSGGSYEILRDGALNGSVRFGCGTFSTINHYQIIHDGQGLTCDAETLTIQACTNTYDGTCNLSTQAVNLDITATGSVTSTDSISFVGSGTASIPYTVAETAGLSISSASVVASHPVVCFDGSTTSCNIIFEDAGFRFLDGSTGTSETIDNQIAGTSFPLRLQAVQNTNGVCTGLFTGDRELELSQENVNPSGSGGLRFSVDGANVAKHPSTSTTTLNFGSDSIATIPTPIYFDAGQIRLHANYNAGGIAVSGSSNAFWVSPAQLTVSATNIIQTFVTIFGTDELNGASADATYTYEAGRDFRLSVSALNSVGSVTQNYSPGQIQFALRRTGPTLAGSVDGSLTYAPSASMQSSLVPAFQNVNLNNFVAGISRFDAAQYSEVGLLNLDLQDSDYGNSGIVVPGTDINIGRFIPDYFVQTVADNGMLHARCGTRTAFHAYSGQLDEATNLAGAISYLSNPILAITAYNRQGSITQNYFEDSQGSANDFMKLTAADIAITSPNFDQVATGVNGSLLPLTASMSTGILSQNDLRALPNTVALPRGVLHYQLSNDDRFFYNRSANALVMPFTADIDFAVSIIRDADSVDVTSTVNASPVGVEMRFGRMMLENSYGPETANFPQPMRLEHFDGNDFITSSDNNCTSYDASRVMLSNISLDPALTSLLGGTGNFAAGQTLSLGFQAPGTGNQGQIGVLYDTFDWLRYDWDNDGAYDDNPSAVATFGLFRGDDRLMHWREGF